MKAAEAPIGARIRIIECGVAEDGVFRVHSRFRDSSLRGVGVRCIREADGSVWMLTGRELVEVVEREEVVEPGFTPNQLRAAAGLPPYQVGKVPVPEFAGYERGYDAGFKAARDLIETTLAGLYTAGWTSCDGTVGAARVKETVRAVLAARVPS